jgi:hypothetical protein
MKRSTRIIALLGALVVVLALSAACARVANAYVPPGVNKYQGPDLMVSSLTTRSVTVFNNGPRDAGYFWIRVSPGSVCGSYVQPQWRFVSALGAYQSTTVQIDEADTARVAEVDYYNTVAESNETNNYAGVPTVLCVHI